MYMLNSGSVLNPLALLRKEMFCFLVGLLFPRSVIYPCDFGENVLNFSGLAYLAELRCSSSKASV